MRIIPKDNRSIYSLSDPPGEQYLKLYFRKRIDPPPNLNTQGRYPEGITGLPARILQLPSYPKMLETPRFVRWIWKYLSPIHVSLPHNTPALDIQIDHKVIDSSTVSPVQHLMRYRQRSFRTSYSSFKPIFSLTSSKSMGKVNHAPTNSPSLYLPKFAI